MNPRQPQQLNTNAPVDSNGYQQVHPGMKVQVTDNHEGWMNTARTFAARTLNSAAQGIYGLSKSLVYDLPSMALRGMGWAQRKADKFLPTAINPFGFGGYTAKAYDWGADQLGRLSQQESKGLQYYDKAIKDQHQWNSNWSDNQKAWADGTTEAAAVALTWGAGGGGKELLNTGSKVVKGATNATKGAINTGKKIMGKPVTTVAKTAPQVSKAPTQPAVVNAGKTILRQSGADRAIGNTVNNLLPQDHQQGNGNSNDTNNQSGVGYAIQGISDMMNMMGGIINNGYNQQAVQQPSFNTNTTSYYRSYR